MGEPASDCCGSGCCFRHDTYDCRVADWSRPSRHHIKWPRAILAVEDKLSEAVSTKILEDLGACPRISVIGLCTLVWHVDLRVQMGYCLWHYLISARPGRLLSTTAF